MNKNIFCSTIAAAFIGAVSIASAQNATPNTNNNTQTTIMTVNQIGNIEEDTVVTLQGNLTQNLGNETYVFTDSTGNLNVVIDDDEWNGLSFNPQTTVIITGEVDKEGDITELDITEIQAVQP